MDGNLDPFFEPRSALMDSPGDFHNRWNQTRVEFKLVVFKTDLPEEGEEGYWYE